jgi:hypothetical protein
LERKVWLDAMHGREVVILDLAQLKEAKVTGCQYLLCAQLGKTAGQSMQHASKRTRDACRDWINSLFTAFRRIVHQKIDGYVPE